jgi:hypothetical protein
MPRDKPMNIATAIAAACAVAFALAQAPPARAADSGASAPAASQAVVAPSRPRLDIQARRDIGCIGYRGRPSGVSRNGKCIVRKKKA